MENEKAEALESDGSNTDQKNKLPMNHIITKRKTIQINFSFRLSAEINHINRFRLPVPPVRPLQGIIDICAECCAPLEYAGMHVLNDAEGFILKVLCDLCAVEFREVAK